MPRGITAVRTGTFVRSFVRHFLTDLSKVLYKRSGQYAGEGV